MIRTLVFDLGGVIMDHNIPLCIEKFTRILGPNIAALGLQPNGEAADMDNAESKRLQVALSVAANTSTIMHDYELGLISSDDFAEAILKLAKPGFTSDDVFDAWDAMHAGIPTYRFQLLKKWHLHYPIYALSNNNEEHWRHIHAEYPDFDTYFDRTFASHIVHFGKPDPRIFELANKQIAADYEAVGEVYKPEETIFIDDIESNRLAARQIGWQTCASVEELEVLLAKHA